MLVVDVSQYCFVYRTCKRESEVGVLSIAHIREILMRHGLKYSTRNFRQSGLRVVAVEQFTTVPFTVFVFYVENLI